MLGYPGGFVYPDTQLYLFGAFHLQAGVVRPEGYPALLRLLLPLHSFEAVIGLQHLIGLGIGVLGYAVLRRHGLPGWGAAVAMAPALLSAYAIQQEHFVLSDTVFALLVMAAVVVTIWRPEPSLLDCAGAGLLLAAAMLVRTEGTPLLLVFLAALIAGFTRWRRTMARVLVLCAAFAVPVAAYAGWFDVAHGRFAVTSSQGAFLYGTVSTFADCSQIRPPPDLRPLCPRTPPRDRVLYPPYYIWLRASPIRALPGGEFGPLADRLGTDFALRAIAAQPLDYARVVWLNFEQAFLVHGSAPQPAFSMAWNDGVDLRAFMFPAVRTPGYTTALDPAYDPAAPDLRVVRPYAGWVMAYQRVVVVSGPLLAVILAAGLAGVVAAWRRRGGPALLPWLCGFALLLIPPLTDGYDLRYVVCAIPPLCVAAGLGVRQIADRAAPRTDGLRPSPRASRQRRQSAAGARV